MGFEIVRRGVHIKFTLVIQEMLQEYQSNRFEII